MALSGSGSRTSRGVNSWSAAVRTPTFMNFGSNGLVVIAIGRVSRLSPRAASMIDFGPGRFLPRTLEDRLDDAVRAVAILEGGEGRRVRIAGLLAVRDEPV